MHTFTSRRSIYFLMSGALVAALALLVACGDDDDDAGDDGGSAVAALTISAPEDGATVSGPNVEVCVEPSNFEIVDKLGEPAAAGEGHVHFYLDAEGIPTSADEPAVTDEGTYHASATDCYTWPDVAAGEHTFATQLVDSDHTSLDAGAVLEEVTATVE